MKLVKISLLLLSISFGTQAQKFALTKESKASLASQISLVEKKVTLSNEQKENLLITLESIEARKEIITTSGLSDAQKKESLETMENIKMETFAKVIGKDVFMSKFTTKDIELLKK